VNDEDKDKAAAIQNLWWLAPLLGRTVVIESIRGICDSKPVCEKMTRDGIEFGPLPVAEK
jgi:hypothetical protein